jgi:hypothetical protein
MALEKTWPDRTSIEPATDAYVKFASLVVDDITRTIRVTLHVYRNREARLALLDPIDRVEFVIVGDQYQVFAGEESSNAMTIGGLVYAYAKAQDILSGAADV